MMLTPGLIYLHDIISWLPGTILGFVAILAFYLALQLPETTNRPMLTTFQQAEVLYLLRPTTLAPEDYSPGDIEIQETTPPPYDTNEKII